MSNSYGYLASVRPADLLEATLYTVPADKYLHGILRIVNHTTQEKTYSVAHGDAAPADADHFLRVDGPLPANYTEEITISAGPSEKIQVKAGAINAVGFHLSGSLEPTS